MANYSPMLVCLLILLSVAHVAYCLDRSLTLPPVKCDFEMPLNLKVSKDSPVTIECHRFEDAAVRIHVNATHDCSEDFPILFAIKQQQSILSFQVPIVLSGRKQYKYYNVSRTLCPSPYNLSSPEIIIDVSTMSTRTFDFTFEAERVPIMLSTSNATMITVSPAEPYYLQYHFPAQVQSVVVSATSDDQICAVLSVQQATCPVYDMVDNVEFVGYHQTITKSGAITIQNNEERFPNNSFFVVVVVKPNNEDCGGLIETLSVPDSYATNHDVPNQTKTVKITIDPSVSVIDFVEATLAAFGFFFSFYVVALVVSVVYHQRSKAMRQGRVIHTCEVDIAPDERSSLLQQDESAPGTSYGATGDNSAAVTSPESGNSVKQRQRLTESSSSSEISLDENSIDLLTDVLHDRDIIRTKKCLCVADLSKKPRKVLTKKYNLYIWNLVSLAIFYVLPVIQLVLTYQVVVNNTGNEDICYYNFRCAHRLSFLTSFNNVFSNIGYIMLGFLFIILVYRRDLIHRKKLLTIDPDSEPCGIPQHFGVFYAMGIALVMEGILSGCYHVCPSYNNFQFDTAFMYMIGWLSMIKIYQTRHPDVNAHAHTAYCVIAFIVFIGVIGVTQGNTTFWIVFSIFYIACFLLLSINIYYVGRWRVAFASWRDCFNSLRSRHVPCTVPMYTDRMALLVLGNIVNWTYAGYGVVTMPKDFASYLLGIVLINLLMYFIFYVVMKLRCREKILLQPLFYSLSGLVVWSVAFYFFFIRLTLWQVTAARSRESNEDCLLMNFYDSHDIWHFLSSTSLFLGFMLLLTLEDDLVDVPRSQIAVF